MSSLFRFMQIAFLFSLPALLGGCTAVAVSAFDTVMSDQTQADCATSRLLRGEKMCLAEPEATPTKVHCYRTLGQVECYSELDPYYQGDDVYSKRRRDVSDVAVEVQNGGEDESLLVGTRNHVRVIEPVNSPNTARPVAQQQAATQTQDAAQQVQIQRIRPINSPPEQ